LMDFCKIVLYFCIVIGLGFRYQKRASKDLGTYFLGGKSMHWLALAMSGLPQACPRKMNDPSGTSGRETRIKGG